MTTQEDITDRISRGLISGNLEPIKCECGCTEFIDKIKDRIESVVSEFERNCKQCDAAVGYWAYGHWQP